MIHLGIAGGAGRMGRSLLEVLDQDTRFALGPVRVRHVNTESLSLNRCFWVNQAQDLFKKTHVVIDFTSPQASAEHLEWAHKTRTPLVIGTTNLDEAFLKKVELYAQDVPLLVASNTSLGICVIEVLAEIAARALKDFDIHLSEAHHIHKKDAPSGTAKSLLDILKKALHESEPSALISPTLKESHPSKIGVSCVRAGGILGDHEVLFASDEETIRLSHSCLDRRLFARGALQAAAWLHSQKPGLYAMKDVLGLAS